MNERDDQKVRDAIDAGARFKAEIEGATGLNGARTIGAIQRLRKAGEIRFDTRIGWRFALHVVQFEKAREELIERVIDTYGDQPTSVRKLIDTYRTAQRGEIPNDDPYRDLPQPTDVR